jgi:hypothetical protein
MSNKNLFYGNWKQFVGGHKLNEMEDRYRRLISNATQVATKNPSVLPFGDIFGDKLRVVIPFVQKNLGKVQTILDFIYNMQETGVSVQITDQVKQVRAKIAGRDTIKEIADFVVTSKQTVQNPKTGEWQIKESSTTVANALRKIGVSTKRELQEAQTKLEAAKTERDSETDESKKQSIGWNIQNNEYRIVSAKNRLETVTKMADWWQKNQSKLVEDVELIKFAVSLGNTRFTNGGWDTFGKEDDSTLGQTNNDYSIVLSRAPIDVLRMSDFYEEDIESCHSSGGSYFYCALAEAQNEGAIAFAVRTEDLQGVDLTKPEIFADQQEGIEGISPLQRVRIRALKDKDKDTIIGVTEKRTYPSQRLNGFQQEVFKAVTEMQKNLLLKTNDDGTKELNITSNFDDLSTLGGSYFDSPIGQSLLQMFKIIQKEESVEPTEQQQELFKKLAGYEKPKYAGREREYKQYTGDDDDEDDEDQFAREEAEGDYLRGVRVVRETFLSHSCNFEWQYGEGYADMNLDVSFKVRFSESEFTETFLEEREQNLDKLLKELFQDYGGNLLYPDAPLTEVFVTKSTGVVTIDIHYVNDHTDSELFRSEMQDLASFANQHSREQLEGEIVSILVEAGYMKSEGIETDAQKRTTLVRWTNENTEHFVAVQRGKIIDFDFMPNKKRATASDAYTNYGKRSWLIAKLTDAQTDVFSRYSVSFAIRIGQDLLGNNEIFNKYFRPLLQSQTLGVAQSFESQDEAGRVKFPSATQQQFDFPFNKHSVTSQRLGTFSTSLESSTHSLTEGITFSINLLVDRYKEGALGYGYDKSDKTNWLYAEVKIQFDIDKVPVELMARFIEGLEENPQTVANAISEILRKEVSKNPDTMSATPEQRGYQTRYEAEKEEEQKSETNLTEAKKRIIKERLLSWYKKNKGRK